VTLAFSIAGTLEDFSDAEREALAGELTEYLSCSEPHCHLHLTFTAASVQVVATLVIPNSQALAGAQAAYDVIALRVQHLTALQPEEATSVLGVNVSSAIAVAIVHNSTATVTVVLPPPPPPSAQNELPANAVLFILLALVLAALAAACWCGRRRLVICLQSKRGKVQLRRLVHRAETIRKIRARPVTIACSSALTASVSSFFAEDPDKAHDKKVLGMPIDPSVTDAKLSLRRLRDAIEATAAMYTSKRRGSALQLVLPAMAEWCLHEAFCGGDASSELIYRAASQLVALEELLAAERSAVGAVVSIYLRDEATAICNRGLGDIYAFELSVRDASDAKESANKALVRGRLWRDRMQSQLGRLHKGLNQAHNVDNLTATRGDTRGFDEEDVHEDEAKRGAVTRGASRRTLASEAAAKAELEKAQAAITEAEAAIAHADAKLAWLATNAQPVTMQLASAARREAESGPLRQAAELLASAYGTLASSSGRVRCGDLLPTEYSPAVKPPAPQETTARHAVYVVQWTMAKRRCKESAALIEEFKKVSLETLLAPAQEKATIEALAQECEGAQLVSSLRAVPFEGKRAHVAAERACRRALTALVAMLGEVRVLLKRKVALAEEYERKDKAARLLGAKLDEVANQVSKLEGELSELIDLRLTEGHAVGSREGAKAAAAVEKASASLEKKSTELAKLELRLRGERAELEQAAADIEAFAAALAADGEGSVFELIAYPMAESVRAYATVCASCVDEALDANLDDQPQATAHHLGHLVAGSAASAAAALWKLKLRESEERALTPAESPLARVASRLGATTLGGALARSDSFNRLAVKLAPHPSPSRKWNAAHAALVDERDAALAQSHADAAAARIYKSQALSMAQELQAVVAALSPTRPSATMPLESPWSLSRGCSSSSDDLSPWSAARSPTQVSAAAAMEMTRSRIGFCLQRICSSESMSEPATRTGTLSGAATPVWLQHAADALAPATAVATPAPLPLPPPVAKAAASPGAKGPIDAPTSPSSPDIGRAIGKAMSFVFVESPLALFKSSGHVIDGMAHPEAAKSDDLIERRAALTKAKEAGWPCAEARAAGYSCADAKAAGYTLVDAMAAGWSTQELLNAGYINQALASRLDAIAAHSPGDEARPEVGGGGVGTAHSDGNDVNNSLASALAPLETLQMFNQNQMTIELVRREARDGELRLSSEFQQLKTLLEDERQQRKATEAQMRELRKLCDQSVSSSPARHEELEAQIEEMREVLSDTIVSLCDPSASSAIISKARQNHLASSASSAGRITPAISDNQWQSVGISSNQLPSVAGRMTPLQYGGARRLRAGDGTARGNMVVPRISNYAPPVQPPPPPPPRPSLSRPFSESPPPTPPRPSLQRSLSQSPPLPPPRPSLSRSPISESPPPTPPRPSLHRSRSAQLQEHPMYSRDCNLVTLEDLEEETDLDLGEIERSVERFGSIAPASAMLMMRGASPASGAGHLDDDDGAVAKPRGRRVPEAKVAVHSQPPGGQFVRAIWWLFEEATRTIVQPDVSSTPSSGKRLAAPAEGTTFKQQPSALATTLEESLSPDPELRPAAVPSSLQRARAAAHQARLRETFSGGGGGGSGGSGGSGGTCDPSATTTIGSPSPARHVRLSTIDTPPPPNEPPAWRSTLREDLTTRERHPERANSRAGERAARENTTSSERPTIDLYV